MSFVTDKQTLTDLNLLGKYKTGSMFNLFNRVKTRGGELLLEDMFRSPLTDAAAINQRSARIRYLQEQCITFSIEWQMTEEASQYLTEHRPSTRLASIFNCYRQKTEEVLYRSQKFNIQQRQIYAVQEVLSSASNLLGQLKKKEKAENPCMELQQKLNKIINLPSLKQLKAKYPYTIGQTAQCQFLFRNKFRQDLEELLRVLYEFDVYISVAEVAETKKLAYPEAMDHLETNLLIKAEDLKHPSLNGAVGNKITLSTEMNLLFLTGANMAGKSTWMKTLGISYYLAHMGFPVAAAKMSFGVMEGIYTSINVSDDIGAGWSHFYAEVMRVKLVAEELSKGKRLFVLFDELFKGTNVKDAYDATLAITQHLTKYYHCAFVISTHIIEVGEALRKNKNIRFDYMPTVMNGTHPCYTYHLTEGITEDRQGMLIIQNEGVLELLQSKVINM